MPRPVRLTFRAHAAAGKYGMAKVAKAGEWDKQAAAAEADPQGAVRFLAVPGLAAATVASTLSPAPTTSAAVQPAAGANLDAASPAPGSSTTVAPKTLADPAAPRSDLAMDRPPESATPPDAAPQVLDPMVSELRLGRTASLVQATPTVVDPAGPTAAATPLAATGQQVRQVVQVIRPPLHKP
mgnify:CR=1 FL=1